MCGWDFELSLCVDVGYELSLCVDGVTNSLCVWMGLRTLFVCEWDYDLRSELKSLMLNNIQRVSYSTRNGVRRKCCRCALYS